MAVRKFAARYSATLACSSNGSLRFVSARAGEEVELSDAEAAFVEKDSPGTLVPVDVKAGSVVAADKDQAPAERAPAAPSADRLHRGSKKRGF